MDRKLVDFKLERDHRSLDELPKSQLLLFVHVSLFPRANSKSRTVSTYRNKISKGGRLEVGLGRIHELAAGCMLLRSSTFLHLRQDI